MIAAFLLGHYFYSQRWRLQHRGLQKDGKRVEACVEAISSDEGSCPGKGGGVGRDPNAADPYDSNRNTQYTTTYRLHISFKAGQRLVKQRLDIFYVQYNMMLKTASGNEPVRGDGGDMVCVVPEGNTVSVLYDEENPLICMQEATQQECGIDSCSPWNGTKTFQMFIAAVIFGGGPCYLIIRTPSLLGGFLIPILFVLFLGVRGTRRPFKPFFMDLGSGAGKWGTVTVAGVTDSVSGDDSVSDEAIKKKLSEYKDTVERP